MTTMSIIFLLTLAVIEKCTATDDGEKLYNFVKDYPASCDPSTMQRLMGENMIQTLVIPFQASPATGYLRLVKLGYVPTQGFGTSKVSIYNVKDDGQTYDFRFTYSMQGMKLTAEKAELLFNNQLTDVQFRGLFDYTEIHLSFKKTQINGRAQVDFDAFDIDYISLDTKVSGVEAALTKVVSHAAYDHLKRMYTDRGAFSWTNLAVNDLAPKLQDLLSN